MAESKSLARVKDRSKLFAFAFRFILTNGHRQEQKRHKKWQKRRKKESVSCSTSNIFQELRGTFSSSADPFSKKDWYDIKAPANFEVRNLGRTLVSRTTGTSMCLFLSVRSLK